MPKQPTWEKVHCDPNLCEYCEVGPYLCCVEQSLDELGRVKDKRPRSTRTRLKWLGRNYY